MHTAINTGQEIISLIVKGTYGIIILGKVTMIQQKAQFNPCLLNALLLDGMKEISFNTAKPGRVAYVDLTKQITPEIYLGYSFARAPPGNPQNLQADQTIPYSIPPNTSFNPDTVYLDGQWKNNPDNMELQSNTGRIILTYYAKDVNIVAGGHGQKGIVTEDGATKISNKSLGKDLTPDGKFNLMDKDSTIWRYTRAMDLIPS